MEAGEVGASIPLTVPAILGDASTPSVSIWRRNSDGYAKSSARRWKGEVTVKDDRLQVVFRRRYTKPVAKVWPR